MEPNLSNALEISSKISPTDKTLVDSILNGNLTILSAEDRQRVASIFNTLDARKNGVLEYGDFHHDVPLAREALHEIWEIIKENFDFYGTKRVDPQEFLAYFVIHTLFLVNCGPFPDGNLGGAMLEWINRFQQIFRTRVQEFETLIFHTHLSRT